MTADSAAAHAHWDERYRSAPADTLSWYEDDPATSLELIDELGVAPQDSVIDVGGGQSRLVDRLLDRGATDLTVLDASAVALDASRARLAGAADRVQWVVADVRAWHPPRRWDLWHDRAVFHFMVSPAERAGYLGALTAGVAPGGAVVLATFAGDGPTMCSGLPVARYGPDDLAATLAAAGSFRIMAARRQLHTTPGGAPQPFSWVAARRSG